MIINIVGGKGVMGSVHKKVFEKAGHKVIISGRNSNPSPIEGAKSSDLTIISVPIKVTEETIKNIAPHCKAIMDFTSIKEAPIKTMLKYSKKDCEVGGLHPLYGNVDSIKGKTVIYCRTKKSGRLCEEIVKSLSDRGAKIIVSKPKEHDLKIAVSQNARIKLIEAFSKLIKKLNIPIKELYDFSPPPTKILLNLLARQIDESNDDLYESIKKDNPFDKKIERILIKSLKEDFNAKEIRDLFKDLKYHKDLAKDLIDNLDKS